MWSCSHCLLQGEPGQRDREAPWIWFGDISGRAPSEPAIQYAGSRR